MNRLAGQGKSFVFIIDYKQERAYVEMPERIDESVCRYDFNGVTNVCLHGEDYKGTVEWEAFPMPLADYRQAFDKVRGGILAGNSYLANLTCRRLCAPT